MQKGIAQVYLLIILLILGVGGYFYFSKSSTKPVIPQPTPSITPTKATDETANPDSIGANWKTYTNAKYGFEFRYPSNFSNSCCNISGPIAGNPERIIVLANESTGKKGTDAPFDGVAIYVIANQKSFNTYIEEEKQAQLNMEKQTSGSTNIGTQSSFTLNNMQGIILSGYLWDDIKRFYVPILNNKYTLFIAKTESSEGSFDAIFDQILSTFKFTN